MEQSIESKKFSFGKKLKSKNAQIDGTTSIKETYNVIATDNDLRSQTESIRKITDLKIYRDAKLELPFVMPSGIFEERRKTSFLAHSGFICIDIDKIENVQQVIEVLTKLPFVALEFISPSAKGVKAFIPIDIDSAEHLDFFLALEKYFKEEHDIELDPACKDISRSCLLSHDPSAYLNLDAEILSRDFVSKWYSPSRKTDSSNTLKVSLSDMKFDVLYLKMSKEKKEKLRRDVFSKAKLKIANAEDGMKHATLLNQSTFCGYCAKFGVFTIEEAYEFLLKSISKRKIDSLVDAKQTIINGLHFGVSNAPNPEKLGLLKSPKMYVVYGNKDEGFQIHIPYINMYRFLNYYGFWLFPKDKTRIFVRIQDNIISRIDKYDIIQFVIGHIRSLPWQLKEDITRDDLEELFRRKINVLFSENQMNTFEPYFPRFNKDDSRTAYYYFKNGFLEVKESSVELLPYSELNGVIWDTQILDRDFNKLELSDLEILEQTEFAKFILGISDNREGENRKRFQSIKSILGYLLHRYKDPSYTRAVIFCDEDISQHCMGGTGKGIVLKSVSKFRNCALLDGKNFNFNSQFAFQQIGLDTELMIFEDVNPKFDFERLFSVITEGLSIERKNKDKYFIPFDESPKIVITTNYIVEGGGNSHRRRRIEYEFSQFYNESHTPNTEFDHNLFDDWGQNQWQLFDNFMIGCVQYFLSNGVINPPKINIAKRKLLQNTGEEFVHFTATVLKDYIDEEVSKTLLKNKFIEMFPEFEYKKWFSSRVFYRWLRTYAEVFELDCSERVSNNNQLILIQKNKY
ncbi:BT4734/BF3469 family protein [uncultured Croceitalea sp.]|uniref:BT4734/BF3469 family protein n=1 Tax=uncultured Croceitalea sp. TaxID=1798908 RepID=UPI003305EED7